MYSAVTSQNLVILNIPFIAFLNSVIFILFTYLSSIEHFMQEWNSKKIYLYISFIEKMKKNWSHKEKNATLYLSWE